MQDYKRLSKNKIVRSIARGNTVVSIGRIVQRHMDFVLGAIVISAFCTGISMAYGVAVGVLI